MKELEFYSGDRKAANITDGGEHIFFCLTRKSKDQMSNDRNVSFMQIRYCLLKLGEGKTASDRVKCFVVDSLSPSSIQTGFLWFNSSRRSKTSGGRQSQRVAMDNATTSGSSMASVKIRLKYSTGA